MSKQKTYTYGDSEQNDKSNHENDLSHHIPSISDDKDNVMRENHIVDDNPDNDINTPSLSKTDDDRKLDEKIHVEDKHKQNADSSETVDIKVSQLHLIVALKKEIFLLMTMIN